VSFVISRYPILCVDDVGSGESRGNWILHVEIEHLQRTIIKLHEILARQLKANFHQLNFWDHLFSQKFTEIMQSKKLNLLNQMEEISSGTFHLFLLKFLSLFHEISD
jgi:hypothetical protein